MSRHRRASVILLLLTTGGAGCAKAGGSTTAEAADVEATARADKPRDFIRYDTTHVPHDFIKIETVAETTGATAVSLPGRVAFDEDHTQRLASPIDGRVVDILVKLGDRVRAGQPLIRLSSPSVGQVQADEQKASSDLAVAEKAMARVRSLQAEGAASDREVAQVDGDLRKARADRARAGAQLKALGVSATDPAVGVVLRAQIPGVVVERNVLVGTEVRAGQVASLLTISNLGVVWVMADAYEQDLGLVSQDDPVIVRVPAYPSETFAGRVGHIGDVVDPATRTVKIRCVAANPAAKLKPEMFARVDVTDGGRRRLIWLSSKAVLTEGDKTFVIVASEGNEFRVRRVDVGPENDGRVRLLSGLTPGDKVVTEGAIFMKREIENQ